MSFKVGDTVYLATLVSGSVKDKVNYIGNKGIITKAHPEHILYRYSIPEISANWLYRAEELLSQEIYESPLYQALKEK